MTSVIEIRDLKVAAKTDSGRIIDIIKGVSFDVAAGEIVALIGESGSGKTTIALSLMGYTRSGCWISGGQVTVDGQDMVQLTERERATVRGTKVAYVPQSAAAAFNPAATIMDQVIEVTRIHGLMAAADARKAAIDLFRALSLPNPETIGNRYPHQVSGGQLQRLSAAMALIGNPKVMIFDEPTTALDVTTQIEVLRAFKAVMRKGKIAGVYVSHDLAVVAQIADRIIVLRDGSIQESATTDTILNRAQHPYTQQLLAAFHPSPRNILDVARRPQSNVLLQAEGLVAGYGPLGPDGLPTVRALSSVSLSVQPGRNLGIIGESGCGKSTLARTIAGIVPRRGGSIIFNGQELAADAKKRTHDQLRDLQIVFQSADTALNPVKTVEDILGRPLTFYHGLRGLGRSHRIDQLLDMVRLPKSVRSRRAAELSGGQKQRVNFARALAAEPKLILCDEITSALDTVVSAAILDLLKELQAELDLSYMFISHDLSVVKAICDDVLVMYGGEKIEQLTPSQIGAAHNHPYSRLLFSSTPKLDPNWLDQLDHDLPKQSA